MIVYNVTVKVELQIHEIWVQWMKEDHIPRILETGCFTEYKIYRIMEENQADGMTYAVQYMTPELSKYFDFQNNHAVAFQKEMQKVWPEKYAAFMTLLKEI